MDIFTFIVHLLLIILLGVTISILIFLYKIGYFFVKSNKVDKESSSHGGELVADVLEAHKIKFIFTLTGGHISPILVASESRGIRVVDTRHEATAVFAADAVARLSGTVGVAAVTAGPGLTNTVTAVKNAQMAESPLLLIGGAAATLLKGRGALQDIDQMSLFKPLCKYCATISTLREIKPTLCKALQIAQSGTPGPVFVEFPIDTLYPYSLVQQELGMNASPKGFIQKAINFYLSTHINNVFAGAFNSNLSSDPLPVDIQFSNEQHIQKCIELISRAKRPVILLGSQSTLPPTSIETLRTSIEKLGIPCFLGGMSRGLLGQDSPLQMRHCRKQALKEADLVILGGLVCDFRMSYGRVLNHHSKIISINRNKSQLYKNSDMFWKPTLAIQADVGSTIVEFSNKTTGYKCPEDWIAKLKALDNEKEASISEMCLQKTDIHLNPVKVLKQLDAVLPQKSILVADGGDFVGTAAYVLRPRGPHTWLDPGAFGTLGCGGGFALGAKLCRPDHDVYIIYGDGSLGFSMAEFDTFTRHNTPVIAVIGNDACWSQIARDQIRIFNTPVASKLAFCDYGKVAEGLGGVGLDLNRENEATMKQILQNALELSRGGKLEEAKSVLINCFIGKTTFRDGSISV